MRTQYVFTVIGATHDRRYQVPVVKSVTQSVSKCVVTAVPAGSPSCGGGVTVYVKSINQPSFPIPFYSVLVSISV